MCRTIFRNIGANFTKSCRPSTFRGSGRRGPRCRSRTAGATALSPAAIVSVGDEPRDNPRRSADVPPSRVSRAFDFKAAGPSIFDRSAHPSKNSPQRLQVVCQAPHGDARRSFCSAAGSCVAERFCLDSAWPLIGHTLVKLVNAFPGILLVAGLAQCESSNACCRRRFNSFTRHQETRAPQLLRPLQLPTSIAIARSDCRWRSAGGISTARTSHD
jgi:hypothetical protein